MSDLFDIPESKSPRILWQERHEITCVETDLDRPENRWQAMHAPTKTIVRGPTREDALVEIARKLGLRLWNESTADGGVRLTTCSRSWLVCDGCGKLWEDTAENMGEMCECGRLCIRMEWATEKDLLTAISSENTEASPDEGGAKS